MPVSEYVMGMARSSTTSDVFNAIAEARRREVLDVLIAGEKAVGDMEAPHPDAWKLRACPLQAVNFGNAVWYGAHAACAPATATRCCAHRSWPVRAAGCPRTVG
jgi:hypothetical protein